MPPELGTSPATTPVTFADVEESGYMELLRAHPDAGYGDMETLFRCAMNEAGVDGRAGAARALRLLSGVCSLRLAPEDKTAVYRRMVDFDSGGGSMQREHLGAGEVAVLARLVDGIAHPALRARLADLVERKEMERECGYGVTLAVHAIPCDKSGPNLRNEVAHGLATRDLCESAHALYAWWLVLQLVAKTCAAAIATTPDGSHRCAGAGLPAGAMDAGGEAA